MGHWNHRVVKRLVDDLDGKIEWFGIHECFYGLSDESDPSWTENAVRVEGESIEELRETLERMLRCLDRPVIDGTEGGDGKE